MLYRVIGALIGYALGNILGAVAGWFLGGFIGASIGSAGLISPRQRHHRQEVFLKTAFTLMGRLAKADGRISEQEITHIENFMQQLGMTPEHRQQAIALFKEGAKPEFDIQAQLAQFLSVCGQSSQLRRLLVIYLIGVAMADGALHSSEELLLKHITQVLGFPPAAFEQMLNMLRGQDHFASGSQTSLLQDAYQALGVSESNSDAQIKKAYRKLMSQYHPDKLIGQGVPEDMIKTATVRSQEVQKAYDLIKNHRNL